jgi:methylated-DNA-[protein]-cysteine S-methyltransferase
LSVIRVDLGTTRSFAGRVLEACRRIPFGETMSYADLADAAGSPRAARAVGNVMAANRIPLIIPCHRVVGAGNSLGGYSAPAGLAMKKRLLAMEAAAAGRTAEKWVPLAERDLNGVKPIANSESSLPAEGTYLRL